ncbi:transposase [Streptosporangium subroseum]|nr:transposase [Streptosporangium subroseum]
MLSREGRPTPLGDAIAHYGRISKTLHILRMADEPGYRHQIKRRPTCKKAATPWPAKSSTARTGSSTRTTRRGWRTRSARSSWS